mmetsp:Transcript_85398/g.173178  ORF Transcript_85398/g.173178 Transcript_85398/m.173178 type:complete len:121 (-) Transcript_85398:866-1228(-)
MFYSTFVVFIYGLLSGTPMGFITIVVIGFFFSFFCESCVSSSYPSGSHGNHGFRDFPKFVLSNYEWRHCVQQLAKWAQPDTLSNNLSLDNFHIEWFFHLHYSYSTEHSNISNEGRIFARL